MSWIAWRLAAAISYSQPGSRSGITHLPAPGSRCLFGLAGGRLPGPRTRREALCLSALLGWRDGGWGAPCGTCSVRPISSNGPISAGRVWASWAALCTQDSGQFCVVLSPFESQKTSDLGLSRRGPFKDLLGWSDFQKNNRPTNQKPKNERRAQYLYI